RRLTTTCPCTTLFREPNSLQNGRFDKDVVEKIAVNLLSNAIKYSPGQGTVTFNAYIDQNLLHIEVKNTGKGMKQETLEKIFTRFYQEDKHRQGSGIGLSLVKELVALHKGKIDVQSKPNEWTTFYVTIPVHKDNYSASEI